MFAAKEAIYHVWDFYSRTVNRSEGKDKLRELMHYIESLLEGVHK